MTAPNAADATANEHPILNLEHFLPYRLSVLSNRVSADIARFYQNRFGLSVTEWRAMAVLGRFPGISAMEVAERTAMDKVAVSRAVNAMPRTPSKPGCARSRKKASASAPRLPRKRSPTLDAAAVGKRPPGLRRDRATRPATRGVAARCLQRRREAAAWPPARQARCCGDESTRLRLRSWHTRTSGVETMPGRTEQAFTAVNGGVPARIGIRSASLRCVACRAGSRSAGSTQGRPALSRRRAGRRSGNSLLAR